MSSVKYSKDCADLSRAEATIAAHSGGQLQNVERSRRVGCVEQLVRI